MRNIGLCHRQTGRLANSQAKTPALRSVISPELLNAVAKMRLEMARARPMLPPMGASSYSDIKDPLRHLYLEDALPWLVGFSGGKDSTMLASLIVEVVAGIPEDQRKKPVAILCTDTRVEIPTIVEMVEGTLSRIQRFSQQSSLNIEVNLLRPPPEQSIRANLIGRGYPPTNPTFRWCTQCVKIDPVTAFVN